MELTISDTTKNKAYWQERPYINKETKSLLADAEVFILPDEDLREYHVPLFPSDMMAMYDHLKIHLSVEAVINDEDYHELSLNSKVHRYGIFLVTSIVIPLFVNVISDYITDKLKHEDPKDEIELEVIVESKSGQTKSIKFKGNSDDFNKAAKKIKELAEDSHEHRTDTSQSTQEEN